MRGMHAVARILPQSKAERPLNVAPEQVRAALREHEETHDHSRSRVEKKDSGTERTDEVTQPRARVNTDMKGPYCLRYHCLPP